ncbi:girdin homolog [Stomoxys calcitrans]|uniref:CCDC113/CCDC96 coiled-coil domain-containing protein n=1 Tax=Stomoxys calcitrans TaxID=35570 RepID=A0A1I8QDY5_STOCA|nr:girdin homolog [Stomoxys calcitrans]
MPPKRKAKADKDTSTKSPKKAIGKIKNSSKKDMKTKVTSSGNNQRSNLETKPTEPIQWPSHNEEGRRKRFSDDSISIAEVTIQRPSIAKRLRLSEANPLKKAIEELVMEDEASSESEYAEIEYETSKESVITDVEQILVMPSFSDEEDSESIRSELEKVPDFFENFGDIPDLEQVSIDLSADIVKDVTPKAEVFGLPDMGTFVNPLTGQVSSSSNETLQQPIVMPEVKKAAKPTIPGFEDAEEETTASSDLGSVFIALMSDQELPEDSIVQKIASAEDVLTQFIALDTQARVEVLEEIDADTLAREEAARLLHQQTSEFIHDLIDQAVEKAEYIDSRVILRKNLDKRKLLKELHEKLASLEIERRGQQFLNRKCVEYFRRKRSLRPIMSDNRKTFKQVKKKYEAAIGGLDRWLIREQEVKTLTQQNLGTLAEKLEEVRVHSTEGITNLEELIANSLRRENFDKLPVVVENCLLRMNSVRKEISKVLFQLIQKQHDMATLVEKLRRLEDLGNGLSMRNLETIDTETQALDKKIAERNSEINKLKYRFHNDIHGIDHFKKKQKGLLEIINRKRQHLQEMRAEKQRLREVIFRRKFECSEIRKNFQDMSFQSGLLDNAVLMKDYDVTEQNLSVLSQRVNLLKTNVNQLNAKIEILESHCK